MSVVVLAAGKAPAAAVDAASGIAVRATGRESEPLVKNIRMGAGAGFALVTVAGTAAERRSAPTMSGAVAAPTAIGASATTPDVAADTAAAPPPPPPVVFAARGATAGTAAERLALAGFERTNERP